MTRKVIIIHPNPEYVAMYSAKAGWEVTYDFSEADLVQFTGGEDVWPALYNEKLHRTTSYNKARDMKEMTVFKAAVQNMKPMAGICRGGQFLNVMCGGSLWQHVNKHAIGGTHEAVDEGTGEIIRVTSTHHQMMRLGNGGQVILSANVATRKERVSSIDKTVTVLDGPFDGRQDLEAVFYPAYRCLCFQPHPEFHGHESLKNYYFNKIEHLLF